VKGKNLRFFPFTSYISWSNEICLVIEKLEELISHYNELKNKSGGHTAKKSAIFLLYDHRFYFLIH